MKCFGGNPRKILFIIQHIPYLLSVKYKFFDSIVSVVDNNVTTLEVTEHIFETHMFIYPNATQNIRSVTTTPNHTVRNALLLAKMHLYDCMKLSYYRWRSVQP